MLNKSTNLPVLIAGFLSAFISFSAAAADTTTTTSTSSTEASPAIAEDAAAPEKISTPAATTPTAVTTTTQVSTTTTKEVASDTKLPEVMTKMSDKVVNDQVVGDEKTTFSKDTPEIFVILKSSAVKPGQVVRSVWVADDSKGVAPPNYKIDEKSLDVSKDMSAYKVFTANFSLSKPTAGWPVGDYHVDLYVDKVIAKTIKFKIQ